jgi:hypothetical protein
VSSGKTQRLDAAILSLAKIAVQGTRTAHQKMLHSHEKMGMGKRGG